MSSKGLKLTSYQVEPPSISFWWRFEFQIQDKALNFLQLRGGLKLQCVGWKREESGGLSPSPYLPRPLPHLFLSFLSWLVPFMTSDSEPESRFCSNDIFSISSASNGAQKFQNGFPNGPPHLGGQRLILGIPPTAWLTPGIHSEDVGAALLQGTSQKT